MVWPEIVKHALKKGICHTPFGNNLVFVAGHPRSGSTLITSLLARHSLIHATPETHFLDFSAHGNLLYRLFSFLTRARFAKFISENNPRLKDLRVPKNSIMDLAEESYPSLARTFNAILVSEGKCASRPIVVEKTPRHLEYLPQLVRWFPNAKVVLIVRDGRDSVESLCRVQWTHSNPLRHAAHWRANVRKCLAAAECWPDKVLLIRYEDLLANPFDTLQTICNHIGIQFESEMLSIAPSSSAIPQWELAWKEKSGEAIDSAYHARWKNSKQKHQIHQLTMLLERELRRLGYEIPDDSIDNNPSLTLKLKFLVGTLLHKLSIIKINYFRLAKTSEEQQSPR